MKSFVKQMAPGFVGSLIIVLIGYYINKNKEINSNQKRYIDCWEKLVFNGVDTTELIEHGVQVLHNGKAILGFSTVNVELYNFSDRDKTDIKVLIEIIPKSGDSLEMVNPEFFGPHRLSHGIKQIKDNTKKAGKGSFILEYLIETANRADSLQDVIFDGSFAILSKKEPTLKVMIEGVGIAKTEYNPEHFQKRSWWERDDNAFLCFFFAGSIVFLITFLKTVFYFEKKKNERWKLYLLKQLTEKINEGKLNYDAQSIIDEYSNISHRFEYEDTSEIMRRIRRMKQPENTDTN